MNGKKLFLVLAVTILLLPALPYAFAAGTISVDTGSKYYKPGEQVTISGVTTATGATVYITVNNTQGIVLQKTLATADSQGKFQATFTLPTSAYIGVYTVGANDGTNKAKSHFVVTKITPADLASNLIALAEDAKVRVEKRFKELTDQGVTIPTQAQKAYQDGVTQLTDAKNKLSAGKPAEALEATRDAMGNFRKAMQNAIKTAKLDNNDYSDNVIKSAIQRGQNLADKLETTISKLEADGETVAALAAAKLALTGAKNDLLSADTALTANNLDLAQTHLTDAKAKLNTVLSELQKIASERAHKGILSWLNGTEERINNLEAQLKNAMNGKNKEAFQAALGKLEEAKRNLDKAKNGLALGKDLQALGEIHQAENDVKHGIGNVGSNESSAKLGNANRLQAQIQFLQRTELQMQKWGMDTTTIKAQIASLQTQLNAQSITP
jgi:hypothetical protein